jgi:signal transduction histidine kinase
VLAGVAGGLAWRLGLDAVVVRLAFVVLSFAGGFGVGLYLLGWALLPEAEAGEPAERSATAPPAALRQAVSVALVMAGVLLLFRTVGLWFGDGLVWSVALAAFGSAVIWTRSDETGRARLARFTSRLSRTPADALAGSRLSGGRIAVGGVLILAGMATFLAANDALAAVRNVAFAILVTVSGLTLILGPWIWQMGRQLSEERRERIRQEERAEMAAHLHDSVLQTLALIQRAGTSQEMVTLARGQERELRAWLYGRQTTTPAGTQLLSAAVMEAAGRVEQLQKVPVEVVPVGDCPVDERLRTLVEAAGEAMFNAAKHSGAPVVSVYVEVGPEAVDLFVRDEGNGFAAGAVPPDRRGIAHSIVGRMERGGGSATVTSEPGEGAEVHLHMPRRPAGER